MLSLLTGLAAGSIHVLSGPDHLAALAPLALRDGIRAPLIGATWGAGHGLAVVVMGALAVFLGPSLDVPLLSSWSEWLVGLLLIGVGLWSLVRAGAIREDTHSHGAFAGQLSGAAGIGLLHGAAGASHLFGVVPVILMEPAQGAGYLVCYLAGAMATMAAFGGILGRVVQKYGEHVIVNCVRASGVAAILVGLVWLMVDHE